MFSLTVPHFYMIRHLMNGEYCNIRQSKTFISACMTYHTLGSPESEKNHSVQCEGKQSLFDSAFRVKRRLLFFLALDTNAKICVPKCPSEEKKTTLKILSHFLSCLPKIRI